MRKIFLNLLVVTSLTFGFAGCASEKPAALAGKVISCVDVPRDVNISSGIELECVDGSNGAFLESLRGPAVINVWGSWCTSCLAEMPEFVNFYKKAAGKIALVGIAVEERSAEDSRKFIEKHGMTWPNFYDRKNKTRETFGMGVPVTWFIDELGEVKYKKIGAVESKSELIDLTEKYLGVKL